MRTAMHGDLPVHHPGQELMEPCSESSRASLSREVPAGWVGWALTGMVGFEVGLPLSSPLSRRQTRPIILELCCLGWQFPFRQWWVVLWGLSRSSLGCCHSPSHLLPSSRDPASPEPGLSKWDRLGNYFLVGKIVTTRGPALKCKSAFLCNCSC